MGRRSSACPSALLPRGGRRPRSPRRRQAQRGRRSGSGGGRPRRKGRRCNLTASGSGASARWPVPHVFALFWLKFALLRRLIIPVPPPIPTCNLKIVIQQQNDIQRQFRAGRLVQMEFYEPITDAIQRESNLKHWPCAWKATAGSVTGRAERSEGRVPPSRRPIRRRFTSNIGRPADGRAVPSLARPLSAVEFGFRGEQEFRAASLGPSRLVPQLIGAFPDRPFLGVHGLFHPWPCLGQAPTPRSMHEARYFGSAGLRLVGRKGDSARSHNYAAPVPRQFPRGISSLLS